MRVLQAVPWYFPESTGGTEVFVRGSAHELKKLGAAVTIAVPAAIQRAEETAYDGVSVIRFPMSNASAELSIDRPEPRGWSELLDRLQPDVVHLHALTSELELAHLKAARRRNVRTLVTLHLPDLICARGTLMRFGTAPCTGDLAHEPCTACRLEARGIPVSVGRMLAHVPEGIVRPLGSVFPVGLRRVLSAGRADRIRRTWMADIVEHADRLVAPSRWLKEMLLKNGVLERQVVVCPQGVDPARFHRAPSTKSGGRLRVGFVGRYDSVKGLHVLIDAVRAIPSNVPVETHVWGIARTERERAYRSAIIDRAQGSPRVIFHAEANSQKIYSSIDVLAVPSVCLETGPLVVLEAQAAGLPVVGSNLGGIAERVKDGIDGVLVPTGDAAALAAVLASLATDRTRLERLKPAPPRTVAEVAAETWRIYRTLRPAHAA